MPSTMSIPIPKPSYMRGVYPGLLTSPDSGPVEILFEEKKLFFWTFQHFMMYMLGVMKKTHLPEIVNIFKSVKRLDKCISAFATIGVSERYSSLETHFENLLKGKLKKYTKKYTADQLKVIYFLVILLQHK